MYHEKNETPNHRAQRVPIQTQKMKDITEHILFIGIVSCFALILYGVAGEFFGYGTVFVAPNNSFSWGHSSFQIWFETITLGVLGMFVVVSMNEIYNEIKK